MEEIIKQLKEFEERYVDGTAIKKIEFINKGHDSKWVITYNYDVPNDEFETAEEMVMFLEADQNSE